jgi:3-oxoacyl-(acyl-carrier-protein) synthase
LTQAAVYIGGLGIITSLGSGVTAMEQALRANRSAIAPLTAFSLVQNNPLPVGQVDDLDQPASLPRTHRLAHHAARQAMAGQPGPPDAIVIGTTTGGIATTEGLLREGQTSRELYRFHGLDTVARFLAEELHCLGPALTVSTACSSGAVAIALALAMLRRGEARTVLAGGVDGLCRLTYFGFHALQLVDRGGCKPLDAKRQGMAVAEGAGMVLLTTVKPDRPLAELLGAGLSCDAYHPAAPQPEGEGAAAAMGEALADAGLRPEDIGYINLHGTGTSDNDLAESKAVRRIFPNPPPLSSIKGATGHSLAAAGAIEAVVSAMVVSRHILPANTGLQQVDPLLGLTPLVAPTEGRVKAVLSNSFGFGGNNGSLVIGRPGLNLPGRPPPGGGLAIHGYSCLTGAGDLEATMARLISDGIAAGMAEAEAISKRLPSQLIRRLKRLPRLTLALAAMACADAGPKGQKPAAVFMGTGWGPLSETHDFLDRLAVSGEQFPSPTDFVGSVHNGPASQVAMMFNATGPNVTASGGNYSFEQALFAADLLYRDLERPALILGADEGHPRFSPLLDCSLIPGVPLADGGGAFAVSRQTDGAKCGIAMPFYRSDEDGEGIGALVRTLAATPEWPGRYALVMAGIPAAMRDRGEGQLARFFELSRLSAPVIRYRRLTGEFASASAVAAVLAASLVTVGVVPGFLAGGSDRALDVRMNTILVLGLGQIITAMEIFRL